MDEKLQDRIDEYILGRMSAEEQKSFEEDLKKDVQLKEQYNYTKIVKDTITEHALLKTRMFLWDKKIEEEQQLNVACSQRPAANERPAAIPAMEQERKVAAAKPSRRIWLWASGIAAVLVVGLFVINPFSTSDSDLHYTGIMKDNAVRAGGDLGEIDNLIANKEYDKALALIEQEEKNLISMNGVASPNYNTMPNDTTDTETQEQEEYERQELQQRRDDLAWMKANALIGLGRKKEALAILDTLRMGGEYKDKADSLYKQIDE